jgi:FAD synthetase
MEGKKVLAGGVFNIIHPGHIHFLKEARKLGTELVVVVASDRTVLEGKGLLAAPAEKRAEAVRKLGIANRVLVGSESDRMRIVREEMPDTIALGFDQDRKGLEQDLMSAGIKCRIVRIGRLGKYSTRKILKGRS